MRIDLTQSLLFRWLDRLPKIISGQERWSPIRHEPEPAFPLARPETGAPITTTRLRGDEVVRLTRDSGFARIEVRRGMIWLTGTPASGDVLLQAGEHFHLANDWPFVLQAMGAAEIVLLR